MRVLTLTIAAMTLLSFSASAQILDRLERRAKQRTNQRIDRKVDEKIDKSVDSGLDAVENIFRKKGEDGEDSADGKTDRQDRLSRAMMSGMGVSEGADVMSVYEFAHSVDMRFQTFNRRGKLDNETDLTMLINKGDSHTGMKTKVEGQNGIIIFDHKESRMITLMENEGDKMGIVMSSDPSDYQNDGDAQSPEVKFTRTGETKKISGYLCAAYKAENVDEKNEDDVTLWMTDDAEINWMKSFAAMSQSKMTENPAIPADYPDGTMIMMETESTKNGEKTVMIVDKIHMNSTERIPTEGYTFMTIGKGQ